MYYHLVVLIEPHPCLITSVSQTFGHHRKRVGGIGIDGVGHFLREVWINWCRNSSLFPCIRYSLLLVGRQEEGIGEGAGNKEWLQGGGHLATDELMCYLLRPYKEVKSELLQAFLLKNVFDPNILSHAHILPVGLRKNSIEIVRYKYIYKNKYKHVS